jgi:hypothetical protein
MSSETGKKVAALVVCVGIVFGIAGLMTDERGWLLLSELYSYL